MAEVVLDVDYNISKAEANAKKLDAQFEQQKQKVQAQKQIVSELGEKMKYLTEETARQKAILDSKEDITIAEAEKYEKVLSDAKKITKEYEKQKAQLGVSQARLTEIGTKIKDTANKQKQMNSGWNIFKKNVDKTKSSFENFSKKFSRLVSSALIFTVVTKAFTAIRDGIGEIMKKDKELMAQWNQIKLNLQVIFMQLYEGVRPALSEILQIANTITQVISHVLTAVFGKGAKSAKEISDYMKDTEESAENAGKSTASFDNVQTLSANNGNSDSGSTSFEGTDIKTKTDEELTKIATISGIVMLGLGLILLLTGTNIPLGLFLIVTGGLTVYKTIKENYGKMSAEAQRELVSIMAIAGGLMLALGIILVCCGVIPLGIGMIVAGAALLVSAFAISPDSIVDTIRNILNDITNIAISFVNWMSKNFLDKLFGKGLSDSLKEGLLSVKRLFEDIISLIENVVTVNWKSALKNLLNIGIGLINNCINTLNVSIQSFIGGGAQLINGVGKLIGKNWKLDVSKIKIPNIPRLATGAVLPGGAPFLAYLNDQPRGQTNIEAPLDTIVEAFLKAQSSQKFVIEPTGDMAELVRLLRLKIREEDNRASIFGGAL